MAVSAGKKYFDDRDLFTQNNVKWKSNKQQNIDVNG